MTNATRLPIIRRATGVPETPARRPGFRERRMLVRPDSALQNLILVTADLGAVVEEHPVGNSETLLVLEGEIEVSGPGYRDRLGPGDLAHFPPGMVHGMAVVAAPARYAVVFAPAG